MTSAARDAEAAPVDGAAPASGWVVYWDAARRFGKVRAGGRQYFVHGDDLVDVLSLAPGQRVTFDAIDTPKGPRAARVQLLEAR